jgi:hypothetical protein
MVELVDAWPRAVGPEIARNAWPARLARDGTLHVATSSSTWAFELSQLESDIRDELATALGGKVPKVLRFATGPVPAPAREGGETVPSEPLVASAEARSQAGSLAAAIEDEELRKVVAKAAAASLERAAADRSV